MTSHTRLQYGVHEWADQHGNHGMEILHQRQIRVKAVRVRALFEIGDSKETGIGPASYFSHGGPLKRRILAVVDARLPENKRSRIDDYLAWCKTEELLEDYTIIPLDLHHKEKTLQKAQVLITAAEQFDMRRKDLFVAIGSSVVTDVVGFAAAIYRRSTPWILVPTDPIGIISGYVYINRLSIHHTSHDGTLHERALTLLHPPIASFYDSSELESLPESQTRRFLAELVKMSVSRDYELFSYVEAHVDEMSAGLGPATYLTTALELASTRAAMEEPSQVSCPTSARLSPFGLGDEAIHAMRQIKGTASEDADLVAIAVGLMSALSAWKGNLSEAHLERVLNLLGRAGLPFYDETLRADALWEHMTAAIRERGSSAFVVPTVLGKAGSLDVMAFSRQDVGATLSLLGKHCCPEVPRRCPGREVINSAPDATCTVAGDAVYEQSVSEDVQYHVAFVPQIFDRRNPTLIQDYCAEKSTGHKKKILVVVDDYSENTVADIGEYFESHRSAIDDFRVLSMQVPSPCKDIDAVTRVVDAAVGFAMSQRDLVVVVGGGTLMDIVGFAAAMYRGGIPYVRIPTTLLGMIDAGVGAKVGVNFGNHKNMIGRYFAPVSCLNDSETFLVTLPRRQFACGLAEAIKMAIVKSRRLFDVIERHHRDVRYNSHTHELMRLSIHTMLEELQPNLYEEDMRRLVDFGHEFGHIFEALARHESPHGECVAVGMAISSCLAHQKGILSRSDLDKILNCILDLGLPIISTDHDCCNAKALWAKISTDGIRHKDGMLYLAVPETIGRGTFIDNISDMDAAMVSQAMLDLRRYADRHAEARRWASENKSLCETRNPSLSDGNLFPPHGSARPLADGNQPCSGNIPPWSATAAVMGASGDIGSQLSCHLVRNCVRVICSVRPASLHKFEKRTNLADHVAVRLLMGDVLNLANLRVMIREADVLYNMAGIVTLGSKPHEFAKVIALNGFVQGIISRLIRDMGRDHDVKVVYPSSQRVHLLTDADAPEHAWVREAVAAYSAHEDALVAEQDVHTALEQLAERFLADHPLPAGCNIYDVSKRLGECLVSWQPRYSLVRISSVYGPAFTRGFVHRAIHPSAQGNVEAPEKRDFIFVNDLNELLLKAAQTADNSVFDAASGESIDLQEVWDMARELLGDDAAIIIKGDVTRQEMNPDPTFARHLLGRDFTPMRLGLRKTIDESARVTDQEKGKDGLRRWERLHVIVVDVGATHLRVGIMGPHGLLHEPTRSPSPSRQSYPQDTLATLQVRLLETLAREVGSIRARHGDLALEEVGISFGAVVTREGIVEDASILWNDSARGYNLKKALLERLPGMHLTILNDISAAAWRYKDEGRFCLITVSSGLSNKVFNADLNTLDKLDLDDAGVGGEMGHVVVEPRVVDALVREARSQAAARPEEFRRSSLAAHVDGDAQKIDMRHLGMAARDDDAFALRLLGEADVPYCSCGNLADLCSYSSGRGTLRRARSLATRGGYGGVAADDITDDWLQQAIITGHPLACQVLHDSTYPLALRILQLAADIGLDKFIIVGGFALRIGEAYLQTLQHHIVRFCHRSAFFAGWGEDRARRLVRLGVDDDNDGLLGMGHFVQHLRAHYRAVEKPVGKQSLAVTTRRVPACGAREVLAKVVYAGICTTDLQILRGERGLEPTVLGHEGVCQVLEVGRGVRGVSVGEMIILNPNNPLDDYDKLGHTREGVFQEYVKFGQEFLERRQVLALERSTADVADTLTEPLSCVVAAQDRIRDRIAGRNVLVVGAGLMGLLFVLVNVKMGARNVFLANRSRVRLDLATASGIIQDGKAFAIGADAATRLDEVSAGEGADIVVICVSLGQGVPAAQDAVTYVNPGGCVYLFAGFRPGDVLALDGGAKLDAWSVRSDWKTERIHVAGKAVDISGHRGSRNDDLAMAADLIRHDRLSFGRVISHVISLDLLPESMLALARDGNIRGMLARRVVVDMDACNGVIERAEELPLRHLCEAAGKPNKEQVPMGNLFREIGFGDSTSLLGWVWPPAWQDIQAALEAALETTSLGSKRHIIWVGTGGWVFLVDALRELIPASRDVAFHICQSLDPRALADLFSCIQDLSTAACLGISQSGQTLETVTLMNALRERFNSAGLDHRQHFIWVTDMCRSASHGRSGEAAIRSCKEHDWKHVNMVPLTVENHGGINALFCTPHSMVMFLPLTLLLRKDIKSMQHMYQHYLGLRDDIVRSVLSQAYHVAVNHIECIQVNLDESIAPAVARLAVQLIEQALGSKQGGFNPRVRVASGSKAVADGFEVVALKMPAETSAVVMVMLAMDALSFFVAAVAYHSRIEFVTHPKVDRYKRRAAELMAAAEIQQKVSDPGSICDELATYLRGNPQTRFVELLCYGQVSASCLRELEDWVASRLALTTRGISIEAVQGEEWNHSRYQAAVQREDTVHIIFVLHEYCHRVKGISEGAIRGSIRMLQAIARATYETLLPRALYFRVGGWSLV